MIYSKVVIKCSDNRPEGIHKIKYKHEQDDKKCENYSIKYITTPFLNKQILKIF